MAKVTFKDENSPTVRLKDVKVGDLVSVLHNGREEICYMTYTSAVSLTNPWYTWVLSESGDMEVQILPAGFSITLTQDRKTVPNPYARD